jgi:hypothetical protein
MTSLSNSARCRGCGFAAPTIKSRHPQAPGSPPRFGMGRKALENHVLRARVRRVLDASMRPNVTRARREICGSRKFKLTHCPRVEFAGRKCACENARVNAGIFALSAAGACAGVAAWAAVSPTSELFGRTLHRTPDTSQIALTFDDGPNPACTPELLKLLERYGAAATFFVVGRWARACPNLIREIADRGHNIGNHTETHANLTWRPSWRIAEELEACQDSILRALGFERDAAPILMRPPFGYRGPQLWSAIRRVGLRGVAMWSLTCYDWKPQGAERLIERLGRVAIRNRQIPDAGK